MWHYMKKVGNLVGAIFGLYMIWNFGVEYGAKVAENKNTEEVPKKIQRNGDVITIDLSK